LDAGLDEFTSTNSSPNLHSEGVLEIFVTKVKNGQMPRRGPKEVTQEHKDAMAAGRAEGSVVRRYLEALNAQKPRRGRQRTPESIRDRLAKIDESIDSVPVMQRLSMTQERIDLQEDLEGRDQAVDIAPMEKEFVAVAKGYGERKGISYHAWREVGVPASVLGEAGITRSS
jgi:hypothetical protein